MLSSSRISGFLAVLTSSSLALVAVHAAGCSSSDNTMASGSDSGPSGNDASPDLDAASNDAATDGGGEAGPGPTTFLDPSEYASFFTIDPAFPYGVVAKHAAAGDVMPAHWGRAGGPLVTTAPMLTKWAIPGDAVGAATATSTTFAVASGLPGTFFYGGDGMIDLPFGPFALLSYTGSGGNFPGEALLYAPGYDSVVSRGKVNGYYSGVGVTDGSAQVIVYTGLSTVSTADQATSDNGLYAAPLCAGQLTGPAPCVQSAKLFGWTGYSGPVSADTQGNVFVAASLGQTTSDAIYGLSRAQALSAIAVTQTTLHEQPTSGTSSVAALYPTGATSGWVAAIGFLTTDTVYAVDYTVAGGVVVTGTNVLTAAVTRAAGVTNLALFNDTDGNFWIGVTGTSNAFLELRHK